LVNSTLWGGGGGVLPNPLLIEYLMVHPYLGRLACDVLGDTGCGAYNPRQNTQKYFRSFNFFLSFIVVENPLTASHSSRRRRKDWYVWNSTFYGKGWVMIFIRCMVKLDLSHIDFARECKLIALSLSEEYKAYFHRTRPSSFTTRV